VRQVAHELSFDRVFRAFSTGGTFIRAARQHPNPGHETVEIGIGQIG
jgi:hypothetical protein